MASVRIPLDTMNKVLGLLGSLPYTQVAELITEVKEVSVVGEDPIHKVGTEEDLSETTPKNKK